MVRYTKFGVDQVQQRSRARRGRRWGREWIARLIGGGAAALLIGGTPLSANAAGARGGQTVVVDPGHGGFDSGALGNGLEEKDITLAISRALGADLRAAGARVVLTRSTDRTIGPPGQIAAGLADRADLANRVGGDVFVSVHANALNDPSIRGVMTFSGLASGYVGGVLRSQRLVTLSRQLANDVQASVVRQTGAVDAGVSGADFYVLGYARMPAVLVETGFLTNAGEAAQLANPRYQQAVAYGISRGVTRFLAEPADSNASATPDTSAPTLASGDSYVVRRGDTLSVIASRLGVSQVALARANNLTDRNYIRAGQTLLAPAAPTDAGGSAAQDVAAPAGSAPYTVRRGDTLSALALRFGVSQSTLLRANGLADADRLLAGLQLRVPGAAGSTDGSTAPTAGQVYRVRAGDTLSALAARFGVDQATLASTNGIQNPNRLRVGQALRVASQ